MRAVSAVRASSTVFASSAATMFSVAIWTSFSWASSAIDCMALGTTPSVTVLTLVALCRACTTA